uniref:hypothetical protein n=1 Tax=Acetivibrio cellulolyticus TaxID=35830 RepID=UPI0001E30181|nr:hypothetical protein [Acetivibrio cellulolyticus]
MAGSFERNLEVLVNLNEFTEENEKLDICAYVFSKSGRLLEKKKVIFNEEQQGVGTANFNLKLKNDNVVVKLGPDVEVPSKLVKHAPLVESILLKDEKSSLSLEIKQPIWTVWKRKPYFIRGNVVKSDNGKELDIPYGEVDIYDVDIGFFTRLSDDIIERLRDALIDVITNPPPVLNGFKTEEIFKPSWWKDDYCGTHKPIEPMPHSFEIAKILEELPQEWAFSRQRYDGLSEVRARINKKIESMDAEEKVKWLECQVIEDVKISSIIYTNTAQLKKLLVDKFQSFRYWLCWFPWIYWIWAPHFWCSLEKLGTAKIKQDGSFTKLLWLSVNRKDIPDLWFVVRQQINGVDRRIYARYPIPCNTHWNHPSWDSVKLIVTDPLAIALHTEHDISEDDELWVCPLAIGNYSLKNVYGTGADYGAISPYDLRIGRYKEISTGLGGSLDLFKDGPFGGLIGLRVLFSSALLEKGVKFYKIKYRSNGNGDWISTNHEVRRHYSHYNIATKVLEFLPYQLGPQTFGQESNLFEIRPKLPPNIDDEPNADWYVLDAKVDLISGYIDTTLLSSGFIEIKLELYDKNGTRINPPNFDTGIQFKLPTNVDISDTVETELAYIVNPELIKPDPENNKYTAFVFKLQIDNRTPTAVIEAPIVMSSNNTSTDCGIVHYKPGDAKVKLSYEARHPNKFAMYSFKVIRCIDEVISTSGQAGDMGDSGLFEINPLIKKDTNIPKYPYLLKCHEDAAFSMNLMVWNMSYDGWNRVGKDVPYVRAFALVPEK